MSIHKHQNGEETHQIAKDMAEQTGMADVDKSRRSFAKSGLVASGVLLTLASRPVLGQLACQTPSGFISGNVSQHGTPVMCSGLSPGYWGNHPEAWRSPYMPGKCAVGTSCTKVVDWSGGTIFGGTFQCFGYGSKFKGYTLMQMIWLNGKEDPVQLGAHIVAALLNANSALTPVLTEADVKNIFSEWDQKGYFEPTAGVKWYDTDIVNYLKSTMQ